MLTMKWILPDHRDWNEVFKHLEEYPFDENLPDSVEYNLHVPNGYHKETALEEASAGELIAELMRRKVCEGWFAEYSDEIRTELHGHLGESGEGYVTKAKAVLILYD